MIKYTHRYLAHIVVQAETPLAVGSGERDILTTQLVATDSNGLPYIPGTALAGILRHSLKNELSKEDLHKLDSLMGFQIEKEKEAEIRKREKRTPTEEEKGQGSRLIITNAQMVGKEGYPIESLIEIPWNDEFYKFFLNLPIRQHVRISHQGVGEGQGKFDEQVIYKGTRFCFELELISNGSDEAIWNKVLGIFQSDQFRIGGGTRKGFGELKVKKCYSESLDLMQENQLEKYLNKTSELKTSFWKDSPNIKLDNFKSANWIKYELHLKPDSFFIFSSGLENNDTKIVPVTEKVIDWDKSEKPKFTEEQILIPATSVKGALAHRVAFHYNQKKGIFAELLTEELLRLNNYNMDVDIKSGQNKLFEIASKGNPAVRALFGYSAKNDDGQRGNVIFSDLFKDGISKAKKKILNHVAIDRFTGGTMDGALFNEEIIYKEDDQYNYSMTIHVHKDVLKGDVEKAFELALNDLASGMLPLGGGTMRGHGCFTGSIIKNQIKIKDAN